MLNGCLSDGNGLWQHGHTCPWSGGEWKSAFSLSACTQMAGCDNGTPWEKLTPPWKKLTPPWTFFPTASI